MAHVSSLWITLLDKIRNGDTLDIVCWTLSNRGFRPPNHASETAGLIERPKTINKRSPPKGKTMKRLFALATAMVFIASLFSTSVSAGDKKKKDKPGKDSQAQQQPQAPQNPPGVIDVGPTIALEEAVGKLKKGETTMEETLALLGQPQVPAMMNGHNGGLTLMYHWRKEFQNETSIDKHEILMDSLPGPFALIGLAGHSKKLKVAQEQATAVRNSFKSLTLMFDEEGKLKQWLSHPLITPKQPQVPPPQEKDKKVETSPPAESPPLAAVQPPR